MMNDQHAWSSHCPLLIKQTAYIITLWRRLKALPHPNLSADGLVYLLTLPALLNLRLLILDAHTILQTSFIRLRTELA